MPSSPVRKTRRLPVVIETSDDDGEDQVDHAPVVRLRPKKNVVVERKGQQQQSAFRRTIDRWRRTLSIGGSSRTEEEEEEEDGEEVSRAFFTYLTLKVLLWDIGITLGDTVTDFCQGVALLLTPGKWSYGVITLAINWLPGIPAAVHFLSTYRSRLPWQRTLAVAALLLAFYPVVPLVAYLNLLWNKPKEPGAKSEAFRRAERMATVAHAISGGIESPVQLVFQCWLIVNGVIQVDWSEAASALSLTDWQGNTLYLPFTAAASIAFSVFSILKAASELNVVPAHVRDVSSWENGRKFTESCLDHLPFLAAEGFFRIVAIIISLTYLNTFGLIPIAVFWISVIVLGQRVFSSSLRDVPLWLISFISLFVPIAFTSADVKTKAARNHVVKMQYEAFKYFSLSALATYGCALTAVAAIVNLPLSATHFLYNSDIVFSHLRFNLVLGGVAVVAAAATALSFRPTVTSLVACGRVAEDDARNSLEMDEMPPPPPPARPLLPPTRMNPYLPDVIAQVDLSHYEREEEAARLREDADKTTSSSGNVEEDGSLDKSALASAGVSFLSFAAARILVLVVVFAPVVIPPIVLSSSGVDERHYVYYYPSSNWSVAAEVIPMNDEAAYATSPEPVVLQGVARTFFLVKSEEASGQAEKDLTPAAASAPLLPGDQVVVVGEGEEGPSHQPLMLDVQRELDQQLEFTGEVVVVSRSLWSDMSASLLSSGASAVVVTDSEPFRPSSPLPDLGLNSQSPTPPVFLARREEETEAALRVADGTLLRVSPRRPEPPKWKCETQGCLQPVFTQEGYISGQQNRREDCYWGGAHCAGYQNSQEVLGRCDGSDVELCPAAEGEEYGVFQTFETEDSETKRALRSSPASCAARKEFPGVVAECDTGERSAVTSGWSKWLRWQILWQDGNVVYRSRRRYCQVMLLDCILEEQDTQRCCLKEDCDDDDDDDESAVEQCKD